MTSRHTLLLVFTLMTNLLPAAEIHETIAGGDLTAGMEQQGDTQTVFGKPPLLSEPVTLITPGAKRK